MISWRYEGVPLLPDSIYDCHGVYSGSAIAEKDKLHLFYTGNIKMDGDYDYINNGRQSSTLHVESEDGIRFGEKKLRSPGKIIRRIIPAISAIQRCGKMAKGII